MKNKLYKEIIKDLESSYNNYYKLEKLKEKYNKINLTLIGKIINFKYYRIYKNLETISKSYNDKFIVSEIDKYNNLLNNINGVKLDENQKKAVVKDPNNLLIIAGAGSGKTLTIIGKVVYLINKGINPSEILCLSFTNMSCLSLYKKLKDNNIDLEVYTFHKLALKILKDKKYKINKDLLIKTIDENIKYFKLKEILDLQFLTIDNSGNILDNEKNIVENIFRNTNEYESVKKLFITFINLFKSNGFKLEKFSEFYKNANKNERKLLKNLEIISRKYENKLRETNQIDFDDMIIKATKHVLKNGIKQYKYIIVDEFQDTSLIRCNLIKAIQEKTKAKIVAVGDDWQSIYHFTGCNLDTFVNFSKYFEHSEITIIDNVYRNCKELLQITSGFITRNPYQISKKLKSEISITKPLKIYYYENDYKYVLQTAIRDLDSKVIVLGRNNKDVKKCLNMINCSVTALTVHKSKGLEFENVILVNLEDSLLGFPNKIVNHPILKYVLKNESYPYEEERRLFYVALTRTKNNVCLLVNKNTPSLFVTELLNDFSFYIEIKHDILKCPRCGNYLIKRNSKYGEFWGCKSYPKCHYIRKE